MTNGEKLKEMFPNTIFIYQKEEDKTKAIVCSDEWLDMEYKEPTTKNDLVVDAVSRQAINGYIDYILSHGMGKKKSFDYIKKFVAKLPSVTSIRPKGHWIKQNDDYYDWYECSECGYGSDGEMQYSSEYDVRTNYCPNCGADMRGDNNDE